MARGQSKLTAEVEVKGAKEGARALGEVDGAQKRVVETGEKGVKTAATATVAQEKLNASTEDYTSLLGRISPVLGGFVDGMVKGAKVAGDFATQQISLRGVLGHATTAIRNNARALKLIGAGGAVVAAISLIVRSVQAMKEAFDAVTEKIREQSAALGEAARKQREATAAYLDDAAARKQRSGDTLDQLDKERNYVDRLIDRYELSGQRAERARATGASLAGLPLSDEETKAAILGAAGGPRAFEIEPGAPEGIALSRTRRFIGQRRTQEGIGRIESQAEEQRGRRSELAYRELISVGGSRANLEAFLERRLGIGEEEARERAEQMQRIGAVTAEELRSRRTGQLVPGFSDMAAGYVSTHERGFLGQGVSIRLAPEEARQLEAALRALTHELRQTGIDSGSNGAPGGRIVNQNCRVYLPGSGYDRNAVVNGETMVRRTERQTNPW